MAVLTAIGRWFRRPSVGSLPLYVANMPGYAVIRCSLCRVSLWTTNMNGNRSPLVTLDELRDAVDQHREACGGW